jgi:hypothetical protein
MWVGRSARDPLREGYRRAPERGGSGTQSRQGRQDRMVDVEFGAALVVDQGRQLMAPSLVIPLS